MTDHLHAGEESLPLRGLRVLVVEDEFLIADEIARVLHELGCEVIGPTPLVEKARSLAERAMPECAVLDVNLRGELILPFAEELLDRHVRIVFVTGFGSDLLPPRLQACTVLTKPFRERRLKEAALKDFALP